MSGRSRPRASRPSSRPLVDSYPYGKPPSFFIPPIIAFYIFLLANVLAAAYAPIQDCDEVFNYWEPTHYLAHGYGLQTWEYSPEFAIRSWAYVGLHALAGKLAVAIPFMSKVSEFYFTRVLLAFVCAVCEMRLFSTIQRTLNPRAGLLFLLAMVFSPGMFHASAAYLPSSFAMNMVMLGMSAFMDWQGGLKTAHGIFWFAAGGILGWPFALALAVPFLLEEVVLATISGEVVGILSRALDGTARSFILLASVAAIDTFFYRRLEVVPFNIVRYNIFSGPGKGPDIFGTEPWHFYVRNLLLNFNIWLVFAIGALPLVVLQYWDRPVSSSKQTAFRSLVFISPFYLWLAIFTLQPHKEERFMFPAYPALALNAAVGSHIVLSYIGSSNPRTVFGMISPKVKLALISLLVVGAIDAGLWRIVGMVTAYSAPFHIYGTLQDLGQTTSGSTLCFGKEWYRFPSSYFLPNGMKAKFVKSAFDGLLPGEFHEGKTGFGIWSGTWLIPSGMNDENREDMSKYTSLSQCSFLVDSYFPGSEASDLEPHYILDTANWQELSCSQFLDASRTSLLGRTLWLPDSSLIPERFRRQYGRYCLLRRKKEI
ncbi:MAG: mannosyltransferase [Trichoglossum hirsutum]|nr:MAG: mannosyltransferase [Trichoglossum hirsutum]